MKSSSTGTLLEAKHVESYLSKKKKQEMMLFERFNTEGDERADELANDRQMVGLKRDRQNSRATTQTCNKETFVRHCGLQPAFVIWWWNWHDCEKPKPKHNEKWICTEQG